CWNARACDSIAPARSTCGAYGGRDRAASGSRDSVTCCEGGLRGAVRAHYAPRPMDAARATRPGVTLVAMCIAQGRILLDVTIVNVALPALQRDLHVSPGNLEWVISAYTLALATLILAGGALGDRYGRKRVFLAGLVVFTICSALCALARTDPQLIVARALQGIGGAIMAALT